MVAEVHMVNPVVQKMDYLVVLGVVQVIVLVPEEMVTHLQLVHLKEMLVEQYQVHTLDLLMEQPVVVEQLQQVALVVLQQQEMVELEQQHQLLQVQ